MTACTKHQKLQKLGTGRLAAGGIIIFSLGLACWVFVNAVAVLETKELGYEGLDNIYRFVFSIGKTLCVSGFIMSVIICTMALREEKELKQIIGQAWRILFLPFFLTLGFWVAATALNDKHARDTFNEEIQVMNQQKKVQL